MFAVHGITHSERVDGTVREKPHSLLGIQSWIALPEDKEDDPAEFLHVGADDLPMLEGEGKHVRLILGSAYGETAPVETPSEMFYLDAVLDAGASIPLPDDHEDRGVYFLNGSVTVGREVYDSGRMMVFRPGDRLNLKAGLNGARLIILGGATLNGPRHIWWNFVASSKDKIDAAKEAWRAGDWAHGRFQLPIGDHDEFIPLPDR